MALSLDQVRAAVALALPGPRMEVPRPMSSPSQIYGRKLRRLLLAALDQPTEERAQAAALFELCHETSYVFCHPGADHARRVEATHAMLDDAQYRAVVGFLEWVADGSGTLGPRYAAVTALRNLWTRLGVDQARITAFYAPFVSYRRARILEPEGEQLACQIEAAFASTPAPVEISAATSDESCDVAMLFSGMRWAWLTPEFLDLEPAALSFLSPEAFHYYVPAFLLGNLVGEIQANPVFHLTACGFEQFERFTLVERTAIVAFLRACVRGDSRHPNDHAIAQALESYWLPSLR